MNAYAELIKADPPPMKLAEDVMTIQATRAAASAPNEAADSDALQIINDKLDRVLRLLEER